MEKPTKLTQEELQQIVDIQKRYRTLSQELGDIEIQKLTLEKKRRAVEEVLLQLQQIEKQVADNIQEKYGRGTIDIGTGEFVLI